MKIINKVFDIYLVLLTLSLILFSSCDNKSNETEPNIKKEKYIELELSLESSVGHDTRSLVFDQENPKTPEVDKDSIEVLCIIKSSDNTDAPLYRKIFWKRDDLNKNKIKLHKYRLRFPNGYSTQIGKKWYIMGVIGGNWNEATKKLELSTEDISSLNIKEKVSLNVPAVSKWVEIPTNPTNGEFEFQKDNGTPVYSQMPFHTQGAIIEHKIQENQSNYDLRISSFTVISTAFSFEGAYDLSNEKLPPVDNSRLGTKHDKALIWLSKGENANNEYSHSNINIKEYTHEFALPNDLVIDANSIGDKNLVMSFWVMPTNISASDTKTNIFLKTTSKDTNAPSMQKIASYGKKHGKLLKNGDYTELVSIINRPKLAIEYMAEYNVRRNNEARDWNSIGSSRVSGSSGKFATNHGIEAVSELKWEEALNHGISNYHLPTLKEFEGILPMRATRIGRNGKNAINNYAKDKGLSPNETDTKSYSTSVEGNGTIMDVNVKTKGNGTNTAYAIHFINDANANNMRVAYRYRYISNPLLSSYINTNLNRYDIELNGDVTNQNLPKMPNPYKLTTDYYIEIEAIYLGQYFLGDLEDIANDQWWNDENRAKDKIIRYLPTNGTMYYTYAIARNSINIVDTETRNHGIAPTSCAYWVKDSYPDYENIDKLGYAILDSEARAMLAMSMNDKYTVKYLGIGKELGLNVRLFSDN